jgi:hypothetical protein
MQSDVHRPVSAVGPSTAGQSSSWSTRGTFVDVDDDDTSAAGQDEIGPSQLQDAPTTQSSQLTPRRWRPRDSYTPGIDALGAKGKGKTRRKWILCDVVLCWKLCDVDLCWKLCNVNYVLWTMLCGHCIKNYVMWILSYSVLYCDVVYVEMWWCFIIYDYFNWGC